jgi:predicted RNA-binding Zn-ribbon protein involved in translation (DUF1610 family)
LSEKQGHSYMISGSKTPQWAPKVPQFKIRLLYERDAQGIIDLDLIEEVGWALWQRCDSILTVTAAHHGHVLCPVCGTGIERQNPRSADETVACTKCGWHIPWAAYHQSYQGKQLFGANAVEVFETYHRAFPRAQAAQEKMVLIDQLIHAFHVGLKESIGRPVAANLIAGSLKDVIRFLDQLTSGEASTTGIRDSRRAWKQTLSTADWSQAFIERND